MVINSDKYDDSLNAEGFLLWTIAIHFHSSKTIVVLLRRSLTFSLHFLLESASFDWLLQTEWIDCPRI